MSCRLLHFGGRPAFFGRGSSGSSTAHCASLRSNRLVTATLATRSPCRWLSWSITHLPETSPHLDHRHAQPITPQPGPRALMTHGLMVDAYLVGLAGLAWAGQRSTTAA